VNRLLGGPESITRDACSLRPVIVRLSHRSVLLCDSFGSLSRLKELNEARKLVCAARLGDSSGVPLRLKPLNDPLSYERDPSSDGNTGE
jgi:hypothetical protein